jgi:antitoxin component YwqK of YwqJK toxin-antitoxin module
MVRRQLILLVLLCGMIEAGTSDFVTSASAFSDPLPELSEHSLPFRPEWNTVIVDTWDGGVPKEILLCTPDRQWPMKRLTFYPSGAIAEESDLLPYHDPDEDRGLQDGVCLSYYETGSLLRVRSYIHGQLDGGERYFGEGGQTLYEAHYHDGKLDGSLTLFWPSGGVCVTEQYADGLLHGHSCAFYKTGERESDALFVHGRLEGKRFVWGQKGGVRELTIWKNGFLHDEGPEMPARTIYWDDGRVRERQSFLGGQPHGWLVSYHQNGTEETKVQYQFGKREGREELFSEDGTRIGRREFLHDLPVHSSSIAHPNGTVAQSGRYSAPGCGVIECFDAAGKMTLRYTIRDNVEDGEYEEWFPNGALKRHLRFNGGEFSGKQEEFFPTGARRGFAEYHDGSRHGIQETWFETRQISQRGVYEKGLKDGFFESWHLNGKKKSQATYRLGVLTGSLMAWYEDGTHASASSWVGGKQTSKAFEWAPCGVLLSQEEWDNGVPVGTWSEWYPSSVKRSETHYLKGQPEGLSEEWYESGQKARSTTWKNGALDGWAREWYEDGSACYEGKFEKGQPQGTVRRFFGPEDGKKRLASEERYVNGRYEGEQRAYFPNGQLKMVASYRDGHLDGTKKLFDESGNELFVASYTSGRLSGKVVHKRSNGMEEVQYFVDNHPEGSWIVYHPPHPTFGRVKALEAKFQDGLLQGELAEFDEEGTKVVSIPYVGGKRSGTATMYSHDSRVVMTAEYVDGVQMGSMRRYFPNGNLYKEALYRNDRQEGEELTYFLDGKMAGRSFYLHGKLSGLVQNWNEKGVLVFEAEYENGLRSGKFNKYYDDGSPKVFQTFRQDIPVQRKVFAKCHKSESPLIR